MKTFKRYRAERSKYPFHPRVEIFSFQPEVKGTCISKKINLGVHFTSPTGSMPLRIRIFFYDPSLLPTRISKSSCSLLTGLGP